MEEIVVSLIEAMFNGLGGIIVIFILIVVLITAFITFLVFTLYSEIKNLTINSTAKVIARTNRTLKRIRIKNKPSKW